MSGYRLFCARGYGSMMIEAAFLYAGLDDVEYIDLAPEDIGWGSRALAPFNPLGQIPTLLLPNGDVLTETAAIFLHLGDVKPESGLIPAANHPRRAIFLRWLVMFGAAVYATFTYGDDPGRWLEGDAEAAKALRHSTDAHREMLLRYANTQARAPWFLGDDFSALDIYVWQMSYWRPRRAWFAEHAPALHAIGARFDPHPAPRAVQRRNGYA